MHQYKFPFQLNSNDLRWFSLTKVRVTGIINCLPQKGRTRALLRSAFCPTYRYNRYCTNLSNCELRVVENYLYGQWLMGLPYYILSMPKVPTTITFVVKRGSNCYKTRGFPRYSNSQSVLSEEVQNLRHVSAWRNDRTSHVYYRVRSLCVSEHITPSAKIRFLDFYDRSLWSFVLPRGIQKCSLSIVSANITLSFHC